MDFCSTRGSYPWTMEGAFKCRGEPHWPHALVSFEFSQQPWQVWTYPPGGSKGSEADQDTLLVSEVVRACSMPGSLVSLCVHHVHGVACLSWMPRSGDLPKSSAIRCQRKHLSDLYEGLGSKKDRYAGKIIKIITTAY